MAVNKKELDKVSTVAEAIKYIKNGSTLMFGGFGGVGNPPTLIKKILETEIRDLTIIGNDTGFPHIGIGQLISQKRVKKVIASHIGSNPIAGQQMSNGELIVEFHPQGTLAEKIRAGGVGLGGILVDVGLGSVVEEGKNKIILEGKEFIIEPSLTADVAIVHAKKADTYGNLIFDKTARNTNPLVAMAGDFTIVEADEIVPTGTLDPECIITPGIFVDMVVPSEGVNWKWVWE